MGVTYIPVCRLGEIAAGELKPIEVGDRQLLLAQVNGGYAAFARECPHEAVDLKAGVVEGDQVRCANHGYCFDLTTGECRLPKGGPPLTTLPVEVRGDEICIKLEW